MYNNTIYLHICNALFGLLFHNHQCMVRNDLKAEKQYNLKFGRTQRSSFTAPSFAKHILVQFYSMGISCAVSLKIGQ